MSADHEGQDSASESTETLSAGELEEALTALARLTMARHTISERLGELVEQADALRWRLSDADWVLIERVTAKLEELTAALNEGHRLLGIHPGPQTEQ